MNDFYPEVGEVVKLKSGSPRLIVVGFTDNDLVRVSWHADDEIKEHAFPRACLQYANY